MMKGLIVSIAMIGLAMICEAATVLTSDPLTHLPIDPASNKDLKHSHGYSSGRSRDVFYNSGGTIVVGVTGEPGKDGENVDTHAVIYYTFQPGLSERTILAMLSQKIVC